MKKGQTLLVLASSSPRRQNLLKSCGMRFTVIPPKHEEDPYSEEEPASYALRAATFKGLEVLEDHAEAVENSIVISADTIVTYDGHILGKPADRDEAVQMLKDLSGRTHQVMTAIFLCFVGEDKRWKITGEVISSDVTFKDLDYQQICDYIDTGEPMDKAGAYAIQGKGGELVASHNGSYNNIVGLPVERLQEILNEYYEV